jgi:hypothetical protein
MDEVCPKCKGAGTYDGFVQLPWADFVTWYNLPCNLCESKGVLSPETLRRWEPDRIRWEADTSPPPVAV